MVAIAGLLVLAAFVLTVTAVIVSVARRGQDGALEDQEIQSAGQIKLATDSQQKFAAAVTASQEARRARLSRAVRIRRILTPVAFGLSGMIVMFALAALFLARDREAATVCALMAAISLGLTTTAYFSAKRAR